MKDCWKILGLPKTMDRERLRQHYLSLVKKYHPDMVKEPELKRRNTIKLQKINSAYEEASKQIDLSRIPDDYVVTPRKSWKSAEEVATSGKESKINQAIWGLFTLILGLTFMAVMQIGIQKITSLPLNHPVNLTFSIIVGIIGSSLISLFVGSTVFILFLFSSRTMWKIIDKIIDTERHAFKIAWVFTIIINHLIFMGFTGIKYYVWMVYIQVLAFPSLLLAIWINDLIKFKKTTVAIKPLEDITDMVDKY